MIIDQLLHNVMGCGGGGCLVAKLRLTLCDSMNCSTPVFPVLHCLSEFAQTHVHWVSDAIQPFHHLSPTSLSLNISASGSFSMSQFLAWGGQNIGASASASSNGLSSVVQSCQTLCDPVNHSTPGRPPCPSPTSGVYINYVHWVSEAIQPSHPLLSPPPPFFNLFQHQGLF